MAKIPTGNYIRLMLDGASPAAFDGLFGQAMTAAGPMEPFQCLGRRRLIALDGTEHFCSRKIHCAQCLRESDPMAALLSLRPRCHAGRPRLRTGHAATAGVHRAPGRGGEAGLRAIQQAGGGLGPRRGPSLTCKPSSHKTLEEHLYDAELEEYRQIVVKRGKRTTAVYRWLAGVPPRATDGAIRVNWLSIEIFDDKGKRTYRNRFVTDLAVTAATVAELAACGRARWKIENETFNVLKTC